MDTKVVSPKTYFYTEGTTTLSRIQDFAMQKVSELSKEMEAAGLECAGPLEFIYFGANGDPAQEFKLQIAQPVKEEKKSSPGFHFKKSTPFKCISHLYKGDISKLAPVYESLYQELQQKQLQPQDEIREVYIQWEHAGAESNLTEIQIGLN